MKSFNLLLVFAISITIFSQKTLFGQPSGWIEGLMGDGGMTLQEIEKQERIDADPNHPDNQIHRRYDIGSSEDIDYLAEIALPAVRDDKYLYGRRINAIKALGDTGSLRAIGTLVSLVDQKESRPEKVTYGNKIICPPAEAALQKIKEKNGWKASLFIFLHRNPWIVPLLIIVAVFSIFNFVKKLN